jgi:hypothetical protein
MCGRVPQKDSGFIEGKNELERVSSGGNYKPKRVYSVRFLRYDVPGRCNTGGKMMGGLTWKRY